MGQLFDDAVHFATVAHSGQTRKTSRIPYIIHPMEVCSIAATMTAKEEVLAAALLHDVVEDCGVKPEELEARFGARVREIVMMETEDKYEGVSDEDSWYDRKSNSIAKLKACADVDVKILWMSDKISNLRAFDRRYAIEGNKLWDCFHQKDPKMQAWYYRAIQECMSELSETSCYQEMLKLRRNLFGGDDHD